MKRKSFTVRLLLLVAAACCMPGATNLAEAQGHHGHRGYCIGDDCPPARATFGYFETTWRRWPVEQAGVTGPGGSQRLPLDVPPIQTPRPGEEADVAPGAGASYEASPSDVVPTDDQAGMAVPGAPVQRPRLIDNPAMIAGPAQGIASVPAVKTPSADSADEAIENVVQRLEFERAGGATLASADVPQADRAPAEPISTPPTAPTARDTTQPEPVVKNPTPKPIPAIQPRPRRNPLRAS